MSLDCAYIYALLGLNKIFSAIFSQLSKLSMILTSPHNPRIKQALALRKKRKRDVTQTFLIEGYRELFLAVQGKMPIQMLFYSPSHFLGSNEMQLIEILGLRHVEIFEVSPALFEKISYRDRPDGLLAISAQTHLTLNDLKFTTSSPPFLLIVESIEKPGNLGSILRSADGAGVDALFVCDPCTDIYNPNVVRASIGTLFSMPVLEISSSDAIAYLKDKNIDIIATSPHAHLSFTQSYFSRSVAIVVGSEQFGLSKKWLEVANVTVSIPMRGVADSLNVSAATTLLLYEVLRQRT